MAWFDDDSDQARAHDQVTNRPYEAEITFVILGDAAAFEVASAYEDYVAQNGQPESELEAREVLAALVGDFIDREVEIKGLDNIDKEQAKSHGYQLLEPHLGYE